ncbi:MAG: UDP-diphospho-muramoylpentapeptide beta-N- acetylglucosaminyltransferase [Parcubacteria group bacterium GW2011_GWE2_39_37]|nr:MAG: UDP-diphospho-muramoylpentapeptide beta-N- acetylglucosaminyltransferase [Parcubacteria group bacterium GW2011_GWE2_39_37]
MTVKHYKILLTGGGTGGSVTPLLAVAEELKNNSVPGEYNFLWIGSKKGVESEMVKKAGIQFRHIHNGKFRRYFDLKNLIDPLFILLGFFEALWLMIKWKPDLIMNAGSFVSVPVIWAGWLLRKPIITHQMDIRPGLANKLMSPFSDVVTVTFEKSLADYGAKARLVGNPIRKELMVPVKKIKNTLGLKNNLPLVLIVGGGTGAEAINQVVEKSVNQLAKFCQIIHITGKGKGLKNLRHNNYKTFEFLNADQIAEALIMADLVISRCGIGFLSELAYLAKPSLLIPMPGTHQEENAAIFKKAHAAIVIEQADLKEQLLVMVTKSILEDKALREELSKNIRKIMKSDAKKEIVKIIGKILNHKPF